MIRRWPIRADLLPASHRPMQPRVCASVGRTQTELFSVALPSIYDVPAWNAPSFRDAGPARKPSLGELSSWSRPASAAANCSARLAGVVCTDATYLWLAGSQCSHCGLRSVESTLRRFLTGCVRSLLYFGKGSFESRSLSRGDQSGEAATVALREVVQKAEAHRISSGPR